MNSQEEGTFTERIKAQITKKVKANFDVSCKLKKREDETFETR